MLEKIKCPERDSNPRHPNLMEGVLTTELPRQPQRSESNISYKGTSITRHLPVVRAPSMRSGCRRFESRSGHLIFSSICSVYIERHIRVDLSDDEQCSKYAVLRTMCMVYTSGPMSMCLDDQQK